jgi:hypothetical protein
MILNPDKVPINLEDALDILKAGLSTADITEIKHPEFDAIRMHHGLGMTLRNEWSLWDKETILVRWFKTTYGVDHADDISGLILDCFCMDIKGKPRRDKQMAKKFIDHWKKQDV